MTIQPIAPFIRNAWYLAAWTCQLKDQPLARTIMDEPIVLFRNSHGQAGALEDRCCHRGAPLTEGVIAPDGLQCGYHGLTFDVNGNCTVNPGEPIDSDRLQIRSYPIVERQQFIWIWMGDPAQADESEIVDYPYHDQTEEWPFSFDNYEIEGNYMLMMDNLMDLTHLGYVHLKTIGGNPQAHVNASQETVKTARGVRYIRWTLDEPAPPTFAKAVKFNGNVDRWAEFEYIAPGTVVQNTGSMDVGRGAQENQEQEGAFRIRLYHGVTPKTETTCYYWWSVANGYRQDDPAANQELYDEIAPTFLEDKHIVEAQQRNLTREPNRELLVRQHDEATAHARRAIEQLIKREQELTLAAAE